MTIDAKATMPSICQYSWYGSPYSALYLTLNISCTDSKRHTTTTYGA